MNRGELQNFSSATSQLTQLMSQTTDQYVNGQMSIALARLIESYVTFLIARRSDKDLIAHSTELNIRIDAIIDLLGLAGHFGSSPEQGILTSKVSFYNLKREVLTYCKLESQSDPVPKPQQTTPPPAKKSKLAKDIKLAPNQHKIFQFIKEAGDARTKEIIEQFPSLSGRTVKRNLKDLVRIGVISKRSENKAVFYFAPKSN